MKNIYYVLLLAFFAFSCEKSKETVEPKKNSKEVAAVLASYGYKPVKDLPSDVKIPPTITVDEFKKIIEEESKAFSVLNTTDANASLQNGRTSAGDVKVASSGLNTLIQDHYPNGLYVRFNFPGLKSIGWPCQYEGYLRQDQYTGRVITDFYVGSAANTLWSFAIYDNVVVHNRPQHVGFLTRRYTVEGIVYEKYYRVYLHVWFNYTYPSPGGVIENFIARIQYSEI